MQWASYRSFKRLRRGPSKAKRMPDHASVAVAAIAAAVAVAMVIAAVVVAALAAAAVVVAAVAAARERAGRRSDDYVDA